MDIIIHLLMIIIIGMFFFIDKKSSSSNAMIIIVLLSFIGFLFVQQGSIEIIDYSAVEKINSSFYQHPSVDISNTGMGIFNVESFFVLVYWFFMIVASMNFIIGKKE